MAELYKVNPLVVIGTPTLQDRPMSWEWTDYYMGLTFPLGTAVARLRVNGKRVDEARNNIAAQALGMNADYLLFLSDDVLAPNRTFENLWRHRKHLCTGVYWTKYHPKQPYLWNGIMRGPHEDWSYGEFFEVDWAGCDCLLIHTDVLRKIEPPWFSCDWAYDEKSAPANLATEDLYFFTKARAAGFKLYCDTAVQCDHQDRETGIRYGLTEDMPQFKKREHWKYLEPGKVVADLGAGHDSPYFGKDVKVVRIDGKAKVKPDILCDLRAIPQEHETYDAVHARHVLEHFNMIEAPQVLKEWTRILKIGGELIVNVPNLAFAAREVIRADADEDYVSQYAYWQIYGGHQTYEPEEFHKIGFTKHGLKRLLMRIEALDEIEVIETEDGMNLTARAKKKQSSYPYAILPQWAGIVEKEKGKPALPENGHDLELAEVIHGEKEAVGC